MLKGAAGLLTPRSAALDEAKTPDAGERERGRKEGGGLGSAIRQKLREVKDVTRRRSRSKHSSTSSLSSASASEASLACSDTSDSLKSQGQREHQQHQHVPSRAQSEMLPPVRKWVAHRSGSTSTLPIAENPEPPQQEHMSPPAEPEPAADGASIADVAVPLLLQQGVPMLKVSAKRQKRCVFRLDADQGQIIWQSKKLRIIPIENIKELRAGVDARYYREQFQLAGEYEERWLTVVYVLDGGYKTLHLIAATRDVFQVWDMTLRRLYAVRQKLMSGLGYAEVRQAMWEKQFWRGAGSDTADQKLDFEEAERMCRRLNINPSKEALMRQFKEADSQGLGYLNFEDFKRFVKALKARPEVEFLYKRLTANSDHVMMFKQFEHFMRTSQQSSLSDAEMQRIFLRYASSSLEEPQDSSPSPMRNSLDFAILSTSSLAERAPGPDSNVAPPSGLLSAVTAASIASTAPTVETGVMSLRAFTSFLLSTDNSAFADQHGKICHDMTHPLPEYLIASSHNTYLVGHQLVGESTAEGYIRALLHSCRSVELDIYDGDTEPVVYHGRTLTSKVSLRDVCVAIAKYAFVASPFPVIISAEVHCSMPQQDMIASIMYEEFGPALVRAPIDGKTEITILPSPEDLKGKILLKAKNLYVSDTDSIREKELSVDTESSSTETSTDSDLASEASQEWRKVRENEVEMIKDLKTEFQKARSVLGRVRASRSEGALPRVAAAIPTSSRLEALDAPPQKVKMSLALAALLVYTVGVKCRGLNKKEVYAPVHVFSLSETTTNRIMKQDMMMDLIKHNRNHLVRIYPKGTRIGSTNYEPHRFWATGAQLVAINWQTFDLGYMINHAMFQRNARTGYVLKPLALRTTDKHLLSKRTNHIFEVTIISAQQLPKPKEAVDKAILDPVVEVSIHIPDWIHLSSHPVAAFPPVGSAKPPSRQAASPSPGAPATSPVPARTVARRTNVVKNNGFNPVWEQHLQLPFDLVGDMRDLVFVRFTVKQEDKLEEEPLAVYCASLGSLNMGYRHLPLHDAQLSQYLFSTLFVQLNVRDV